MHISPLARQVLHLVFTLSSTQGAVSRPRLERRAGQPRNAVNHALNELNALGLIDAQRLRLTLPGLALAVACGARPRTQARSAARRAPQPIQQRQPERAPIALFSPRELPRAVA